MEKEKSKYNHSNKKIFESKNIDYINNKIDKNSLILYEDKGYLKLEKKEKEIREKLFNSLTTPQKRLFYRYLENLAEELTYIKCVSYYLGIKESNKIK